MLPPKKKNAALLQSKAWTAEPSTAKLMTPNMVLSHHAYITTTTDTTTTADPLKAIQDFLGITIAPTGTYHFTSYSAQQSQKRQKQQPAAAPKAAAAAANPTTPKATAKPSTNRCFLYHHTSESSHKITGTTYINSYYTTPPWRYTLSNHINVY